MRFYEVNCGDSLTGLEAPCVLFMRNSNTYHWFDGWNPPTDWSTKIPKELGEFVRETTSIIGGETGGDTHRGDVIYCLPRDVPVELKGLGHFWRYPNSDANIPGYYICDNCGVCCNEIGAREKCPKPTNYSKGGK